MDGLDIALTKAAYEGSREMVATLLAGGVDVDAGRGAPLVYAAARGHYEVAKLLLDEEADPDDSFDIPPPLLYAIESGNLEIVKLLLSAGAQVKGRSNSGDGILTVAVKRGNIEILKLLLDSSPQALGVTASTLISAIDRRDLAMVKLLLAKGVNDRHGLGLKAAAKAGLWDISKALTTTLPNLDRLHHQILTEAATNGNLEHVTALLDAGANLASNGGAALLAAATNGHTDVVKALLKAIPSHLTARTCDTGGEQWAADRRLYEPVFDRMRRGIMNAGKNGHHDIVKVLLLAGGSRFDFLRRAVYETEGGHWDADAM
ncbi:hypothetical protein HDV00_005225 [Rhizophlyctis rosea]|nr:hypothetical protein HDV00_005225 [Rhizophlyctis rosea]